MVKYSKYQKITIYVLSLLFIFFGFFLNINAQVTSPLWEYPIDLTQSSSSINGIDPTILCDQYQNTHILWGDRGEMPALYYMNDVSGEWSAPIDVIANNDNAVLIMQLSAVIQDSPDLLHILWVDDYISGSLIYSQVPLSAAGQPRAWMNPIPLALGVGNGSIGIDHKGDLHVVYGVSGGDSSEVFVNYIKSIDHGESWSTPVRIFSKEAPFPSNSFAAIEIDDNGRLHIGISIRSQDYGEYSEVGYVQSLNGGRTWSDYLLIDDKGTAYQGVHRVTPYSFEGDEVHLTWHDPRRMHQWSYDGGATWSEPIEIMSLSAAFGGSNGLTKDDQGTIHVVTAENGRVYSASWEEPRWGLPERIEDRSIDPHGQRIAICQGNKLQIVYDDRSDTQKIWYSSRIIEANAIDRRPIPSLDTGIDFSSESSKIQSTSTPSGVIFPTTPGTPLIQDNNESFIINPLNPMLIASGTVLALILFVILLKRRY